MYDTDANAASSALQSSGSAALTSDVISAILALATQNDNKVSFDTLTAGNGSVVTIGAGTEVMFISTVNGAHETLNVNADTPVLVFQGAGGVDVTVQGATNGGQRMIIGTAGDDRIVVTDGKATKIVTGTGHSTIVGGTGHDTIDASLGSSTINGGGGFDVVQIKHGGDSHNFQVQASNSPASAADGSPHAGTTTSVTVTNKTTGATTVITGVQYVALDNNDALVFAQSTVEAGVASLYHAAFGRTGDATGIEFWFNLAKGGMSLHDIAYGFMNSAEYKSGTAGLSDTAFITQLYQNTFNRAPDAGGLAYWAQQLAGGASRQDLLTHFASVAALNEAGTLHTETTIVGSVTVVPHIV